MALTDDEAITLAALHGCEFWRHNDPVDHSLWYACGTGPAGGEMTDFEMWCNKDERYEYVGSHTRVELARRYCEYFKLDAHSRATPPSHEDKQFTSCSPCSHTPERGGR